MKKQMKVLFFVLALMFVCPKIFAQTTTFPSDGPEKREKLQALVQERLVQGLALTPEQTKKFSEIFKKYHQKRYELREQMKLYHQDLEKASNDPNFERSSELVSNIQKLRSEMHKLEEEQFKELKPLLTPQQQAKYLLIMDQMRREMMQIKKGPLPSQPNF